MPLKRCLAGMVKCAVKSEVIFGLENASWPALLVDTSSVICRASTAAARLFGSALDGERPLLSSIWSADNPGTALQFISNWECSPAARVSLKFRCKGGASTSFSVAICALLHSGQRYFVLQLLPEESRADPPPPLSASEAKSAEAETILAHKQKLDCALQLTRTVALDFNNALAVILGHATHMLNQAEPQHPWRNLLQEIEKSAHRAADIAKDLGTFSLPERGPKLQSPGNLNMVLQRAISDYRRQTELEGLTWGVQLERKLFAARFDEPKIQQALRHLLENAIEAVQGLQARIGVQTRNIELREPSQDRNVRLTPGAWVCAEISDNGPGIAADVLPRVFEPFFTTKAGQKHRGLGLALVYGVFANHGGGVAISSQPGVGTSVRVYLPAELKLVSEQGTSLERMRGTGTVLVVDDEDLLLTMGETVLSAHGYRVLTANSGQKALELVTRGDLAVDLVITDIVMPGMGGRELAEHVHRLAPLVRVICMSGYVGPNGRSPDWRYLQKPFTSRELLARVAQALGEAGGTPGGN
jgi:two-component system, cell cycle sensor histidine kinase and response regulator CckA